MDNNLLTAVKEELGYRADDVSHDTRLTGYINRGEARLQAIAGAPLDFQEEAFPRQLLLDYCRYANSQGLEMFEKNYVSELLDLNLMTQANCRKEKERENQCAS